MHVRSVMVGVRCGAVIRETPVNVCMGWPLLSYSSVALWVMV